MALGQHRVALLFLGLVALPAVASATPGRGSLTPEAEPSGGSLATRTLWFEPNVGQADPSVQFLGRADGFDVLLTSEEIVLSFREPAVPSDSGESRPGERFRRWRDAQPVKVRMRFKGGDLANRAVAVDPLEGVSHYLVGADRERWRTGVPHYARVECRDIYPGVSLVLRGNGRRLVYDLVVAPHADPGRIELELDGGEQVSQGPDGEVLVHTARGRIRHSIPFAYQEGAGGRRQVPASLIRRGRSGVTYAIAGYDRSHPLVIDPEIAYVTTLGGTDSDVAFGVTGDGLGNAYLAGFTSSAGYPTTPGSYQSERDRPGYLAFVTKLSPEGAVLFSTYLGGSVSDGAFEITLDSGGRIAVAGSTSSADFPIVNGFQGTYLGGLGQSGFVAMLSADGAALVYSSFLGGTGESGFGDDVVQAIAADAAGQVYLGGVTNSADFPTRGAAQPATGGFYDAFVMKINADLVGPDSLLYSTFLGGSNADEILAMAVDSAGTIHVGGQTGSLDFPTDRPTIRPLQDRSGGGTDGFVARIDPALAPSEQILYSTYVGGEARDRVLGLALDPQGPVFAVGGTLSTRFPVTPGARPDPDYVPSPLRNLSDGFFVKLDPRIGGSEGLLYSTYLGGQRADEAAAVAVDNGGNIYIGGTSASPDFPAGRGSTLPGPFVLAWRSSLEASWEWSPPNQTAYQQVRGMAVTGDGAVYLVGESSPTQQFGGEDVLAIRLTPPQQGQLQILTSTTRWRPQKDTTKPIDITFTGPSDLADASKWSSVTAEIKDPNGVAVPTPNLAFAVSNQSANEYKLTWPGPWLTNASNPASYLPRGNYEVVVKATGQDGTVVASAAYQSVSLVEVKKIEFARIAGGAPLDTNLGPGGGTRVFAEAQVAPTSTNQNPDPLDKVSVIATVDPPIPDPGTHPPVSVYFRALDVDDPSAVAAPVDDESKPCTAAGCDNQGTPPTGSLSDGVAWQPGQVGVQITTTTAQASATFQASTRQGDNYRLAASTSDTWLNGLKPVVTSPTGAATHTTGEPLPNGTQLTELVTVWRTLHLEVDALVSQDPVVDQAAMDLVGQTFTQVTSDRLIVNTGPFFTTDHPNANDWAGANFSMAFHGSDWYDVASNTQRQVHVNVGSGQPPLNNNLNHPVLMALADKSWTLRDDEISSLDASRSCGTTTCAADYTLAGDIFARAYIKLEPIVQAPADVTIPFVIASHRNIVSNLSLENQTPSSRTYWATQLVSAFDGSDVADFDPRPTGGTFGINLGLTTVGNPINDGRHKLKSAVFFETIRDMYEKPPQGTVGGVPLVLSPEVNKRVTAHEMLHTFGIIHDALIMCSQINIQSNTAGSQVTDGHIQQLRTAERPVPAPHNNPCP